MANFGGIVEEDIPRLISVGQTVYDQHGKRVGSVDMVYHNTDYVKVHARPLPEKRDDPLGEKYFYVPYRLITNIDPREMYLSVSRDELDRDCVNPPARSTVVVDGAGGEVAITTEPSGVTGAPIVVERVKIDRLKNRIAVGDRVYTSDLADLGLVKKYDAVTGWMLVERGAPWDKRDLMIPITIVEDVNTENKQVFLVTSQADLQRMPLLEPADVVFMEAAAREDI